MMIRFIPRIPYITLALLIAIYTVYFSWYTIQRHDTLHSYAADLSLIDQPMWNTVRGPGGFMELTWGDRQQPRLAEHFEPILVPLSLLFFLWNDVRVLLIAQSLALALGALPVFLIARDQLTISNEQLTSNKSPTSNLQPPTSNLHPSWPALGFALVYLLFPSLQAANVADFHADPFVVTPLLLAFWYATRERWGWMWLWALVAMAAKETLPTLTAMLGLWLTLTAGNRPAIAESKTGAAGRPRSQREASRSAVVHGLALLGVSTASFLAATFLIVAPLARQYFGTAGPIYLASRYGSPADLLAMLAEPARWHYLAGLLAAVGLLPLLAPDLLLLGLPVLAANLLSSYPGQFSGEQHYSAPLVATFSLAAIYAVRRLARWSGRGSRNGQAFKTTAVLAAMLWLLGWSLGYSARYGWTPLSLRLENYRAGPAAVQLPRFIAQIPPEAVVSASAAIHPHLAHRRVIYIFPTVQEAEYLLVDVADIPGVHPNDARARLLDMLNGGWRLLDADSGLILAQKVAPGQAAAPTALPPAFFNFARAAGPLATPAGLSFGDGRLQLLGFDVQDDPDNGVTFRFYWQASAILPDDLRLWPLVYDDMGQLLSDPSQVPMVAALWYPPSAWQPGEIIMTETLPQLLPGTFHLGIAAGPAASFTDATRRLAVAGVTSGQILLQPGNWAQLASFQRQGPSLHQLPPKLSLRPLTKADVSFGPGIHLVGYWTAGPALKAGGSLPVLLKWTADQPAPIDLTVFIHLVGPGDHLAAQNDAVPVWLTPQPTSQWPPHQALLDRHIINLPAHLPPGTYTLRLGLYNSQTLERLARPDGSDFFDLGQVWVE